MNTIKNYLDNIFQNLPQNEEVIRIKIELFNDMEAKYNELVSSGKTQNEAIGNVIADFGNIDELIEELGLEIKTKDNKNNLPALSLDTINDFLEASKKGGKIIAIGVSLIITSVAIFISLADFVANNKSFSNLIQTTPVLLLLLSIIPAVGLFIYSSSIYDPYRFIEKGDFSLSSTNQTILEKQALDYKKEMILKIIIGVSLCIAGPILLILISSFNSNFGSFGTSVLLIMIAIAVYLFITSGSISEAYNKLLKKEDYCPEQKKQNKIIGAVASVVWPLATCIFLYTGLVHGSWSTNWIIWPITGILFGAFAAVCSIMTSE